MGLGPSQVDRAASAAAEANAAKLSVALDSVKTGFTEFLNNMSFPARFVKATGTATAPKTNNKDRQSKEKRQATYLVVTPADSAKAQTDWETYKSTSVAQVLQLSSAVVGLTQYPPAQSQPIIDAFFVWVKQYTVGVTALTPEGLAALQIWYDTFVKSRKVVARITNPFKTYRETSTFECILV